MQMLRTWQMREKKSFAKIPSTHRATQPTARSWRIQRHLAMAQLGGFKGYGHIKNYNIHHENNIPLNKLYIFFDISNMIILFVNAHRGDNEGNAKFERYYSLVRKILDQTIYYGTHFEQQIRTKDQLTDYLYDPQEYNKKDKVKEKFKSVTYVFVDGPVNILPWSTPMKNLFILIRNCLWEGKKVHLNGFGHLTAYYYLSTGFTKDCSIGKSKNSQVLTGKEDYLFDDQTGDLYCHGKKICNSGVMVIRGARPFTSKSSQALKKGVILGTKFHYLVFDAKNSHKLLDSIKFPFSIFEKNKVFCTPKMVSKAKVNVLVETEGKIPIVFTHDNALSTQLLSAEIMKIFSNWIQEVADVQMNIKINNSFDEFDELRFDNKFQNHKTISYTMTNPVSKVVSPRHHAKKKFQFEKPSLRCSGPYISEFDRSLVESKSNMKKVIGRSRFIFKSDMQINQIKNYVQRTPSRPPSAHNFREVNKAKWIDKKTFFVT